MNYDKIAKIVFGENYSLDMLVKKGFYLAEDSIQIQSRHCISKLQI